MKHLLLLTSAALLFTACGPSTSTPAEPAAFALTISPTSLTVATSATGTITVAVTTTGGYNQSITYKATPDTGLSVSQSGATFTVQGSTSTVGPHQLVITATGADGQVKSQAATVTITTSSSIGSVFIPATGAAVGSGDGTKQGTVYISPSQGEVDLLNYINEVRTKGTVGGADVIAGSCMDGKFTPLKALTYDGPLAYAARRHALYKANVGDEGHQELRPNSSYFYGATSATRGDRAYSELTGNTAPRYAGENAGSYVTAADMVKAWMSDVPHCANLMDSTATRMGTGYAESDQSLPYVSGDYTIYPNNWVENFF